jgi:hypothetical protein|tara:strand:+ start:151 stop:387 length:237 start_codon:yes stop_codon:yes gene_type:complete
MNTTTKLAAISILLALTSGCIFLPVAGAIIGATGTIAAARVKMEGDVKKAKAIEEFRDTVVGSLDEIKEKIDEVEDTQ